VVRTGLLSAAALGLVTTALAPGFAQAKKSPAPTAAVKAKPMADTCEFQVRTRSKVGYRGMASYWVKGDLVREEKRSGGGMELIMVSNEKGLFIRNKHSTYWFRYPEEMAVKLRERLLGGPVGELKSFLKKTKATYLGKEKVEGVLCNIWAYRLKGADDKFRLWTDLGNMRPVRMERDHLVRGTKKRDVLVVEYKRYVAGNALADSLFQVPQGQKVHDLRNALRNAAIRSRERMAKEREKEKAGGKPGPKPGMPGSGTPELTPPAGTPPGGGSDKQ
jgi:outer membrane lipoprotein-sorting protein